MRNRNGIRIMGLVRVKVSLRVWVIGLFCRSITLRYFKLLHYFGLHNLAENWPWTRGVSGQD